MDIDKERAAFFEWFAENGSQYASLKKAQDPFCAGYRAALASQDTAPPAAVPAPKNPVGAADGFGPTKDGCCGVTVTKRCDGCPYSKTAAPAQANAWEEAVKDACTVAGELGWNEADPRASLNKLIEWHIQVALDPRVSDRAPAQAVDALEQAAQDVRYYLKHQDLPAWDACSEYEKGIMVTAQNIEKKILERAALAAQPAAPTSPAAIVDHVYEHVGFKDRDALISDVQAMLPAAPAGEPVAWLESEESARGKSIKEVLHGMMHTAVWHFSARPRTGNPVWTLHAPVANAGQAQAVAVPWTKDAEEWGAALNDAAWEFFMHDKDVGGKIFNHIKPSLRAAILKYAEKVAAAPLPQQVAQTEAGIPASRPTSRDAYLNMTPERRAAFDADMTKLDQRIAEHRRSRDRRTHDEPVAEERRHGDRRHAERRDCED